MWTSDYFAPGADQIPLLHYWSLGVEIHFYLLFPLLVVGVRRWWPTGLPLVFCTLLVASLIASEWMLHVDPPAAFYLLPFRAFELLIGAALALPRVSFPQRSQGATVAAIGGAGMVVGAMFLFSDDMAFPGLVALVP